MVVSLKEVHLQSWLKNIFLLFSETKKLYITYRTVENKVQGIH